MLICDVCFVENDVKSHVKAVRHTFRLINTGDPAPAPIKDREIDLCPKCADRMRQLLETLPNAVKAVK